MKNWFYDPSVQFQLWDQTHLITLFMMLILLLSIYFLRGYLRPYRHVIYVSVALLLLISRMSLDSWYVITGTWEIESSLPLELCSIASLLCAVMLLTRNQFLLDVLYFIAIGGSMQALLTPDLHFGFPQYRYIQFFLDHFLLLLSPLLMIWLDNYVIRFTSLIKSFVFLNGLALVVFGFNHVFQANYMFLMHKPSTPSLLDLLGDYPYYLLFLEGIAFVLFVGLYFPFIKAERTRIER